MWKIFEEKLLKKNLINFVKNRFKSFEIYFFTEILKLFYNMINISKNRIFYQKFPEKFQKTSTYRH